MAAELAGGDVMSLWWIPRDRIRELSASDLAVLRMCRVLTAFLIVAVAYIVVVVSGVGVRTERDRLRRQVDYCKCQERLDDIHVP